MDVETALEAAEGQMPDKLGSKRIVPVSVTADRRNVTRVQATNLNLRTDLREVPLKVFNQSECDSSVSNLPALDPLRLRTE